MNINGFLNNINTIRESINVAEQKGETPEVSRKSVDLMEKTVRNMNGDYSTGRVSIQEAITTTDTVRLIPKIIEGQMREAAEPDRKSVV